MGRLPVQEEERLGPPQTRFACYLLRGPLRIRRKKSGERSERGWIHRQHDGTPLRLPRLPKAFASVP